MQSKPVRDDPVNAFCTDSDAYVQGMPDGPLSDLTFAAKDIFDVAGHVTGCGNPDWKRTHESADNTAWAVRVLVEAGATLVGKTITEELTRGIFGDNSHYGTPINPRAPGRVPGGSSSGSASAVAAGLVDFALGSDTGGSVRVPASFCGLYGLRPTHGRIPVDGMLPQAASYDTAGWFARDVETFARVGETLLRSAIGKGRPGHLVIAEDAFEIADPAVANALGPIVEVVESLAGDSTTARLSPSGLAPWAHQQRVLQTVEAWETMRDWIDEVNPLMRFGVTEGYLAVRATSAEELAAARSVKTEVEARMGAILRGGSLVCLPTTATPAPPVGERLTVRRALRERNSMLTCVAGTIGAPQINLPLADVEGLPVGLSLIGERGSDEALIGFAREIASRTA